MLVTNHLRGLRVWDYLASLRGWTLEGYSIGGLGGLYELFHVAGHFEKEVRIGAFDKTKSAVIERFGDVGAIKSYYQVVGKPSHSDLDRVIDILLESHDAEQRFWADFDKKIFVALKREFLAKVRLEAYVESEFAESLSDFGQGQLNAWARHLSEFGTLAPEDEIFQRDKTLTNLTTRQQRDYEKHKYKCHDRVHIPDDHPEQGYYPIVINDDRIEIGDSLFILFLQLVKGAKKKKGGWVSIQDLQEKGHIGGCSIYQRLSDLRKELRWSIRSREGSGLIENDRRKGYRISTHPDFITYKKTRLLDYEDHRIKGIVKKLP